MRDLLNLSAQYGVRVEMCHIEDANGYYDAGGGRIYIDLSLKPNEVQSVFAHELGHVHHGHTCDAGAEQPGGATGTRVRCTAARAPGRLRRGGAHQRRRLPHRR